MTEQKSITAHLYEIIDSIDTDLLIPLKEFERVDKGGHFSIPRQVFCYLDYLGALANNGKNLTQNAIKYMEKYLTPVNSKYSGKCNILYNMWRHGTVHKFFPNTYSSKEKNFELHWGANNTSLEINRKWHLDCFCMENKFGQYNFFINLFELVENLRASAKLFIHDVEDKRSEFDRVQKNYEKISRYIDLDAEDKIQLRLEAEKIVEDSMGIINISGSVIRNFKDRAEFERFKQEEWSRYVHYCKK